jgi:hypothetical protein
MKLIGGSGTADLDLDGDLNVDGGDITTNETTFNLLNDNALTINAFGDATAINIGDDTPNSQTINIGTSSTGTGIFNLHTDVTQSTIDIGTVADLATNTSVITIGGAFSNTANSTLTVKNAQTILDGDLEVNGGDIQSDAATVNFLTRANAASEVNIASRASILNLGGVAGSSNIKNSLTVAGDTDMFGDVTMHGGSNSGTVTVNRARLNTGAVDHAAGSLSNLNVDFYKFVDDIDGPAIITNVAAGGTMSVARNWFLDGNTVRFPDATGLTGVSSGVTYFIVNSDTAAATFQVAATEGGTPISVSGSPGTATSISLQNTLVDTAGPNVTWTNNPSDAEYNSLPVNNIEGLEIGDILIIGTELIEIVSPGPDINTRLVPVNRGIDCTDVAQHADNEVIYKLEKSPQATYTIGRVPQNPVTPTLSNLQSTTDTLEVPINVLTSGDVLKFTNLGNIVGINTTDTYYVANHVDDIPNSVTRFNLSLDPDGAAVAISGSVGSATAEFSNTIVALAEFGGQFSVNDYIRVNPSPNCPSGEFMQVTQVNDTNAEKFTVNNGANQDRFVIDSVFGGVDSTILGEQDFTINLTADASVNDGRATQFRVVNGLPTSNARLTVTSSGTVDFVGNATETDPNARLRHDGMFWLSNLFRITNGNGDKIDSDSDDLSLFFDNSNGNLDVQGHIRLGDDLSMFKDHGPGVGFTGSDRIFYVNNADGDTTIGLTGGAYGEGDLTVNGGHLTLVGTSTATPSSTDYPLSITNMGVSGNRNYRIRRDAAIDAFGVTQFYNRNGGRRWDYITQDTTLSTGINYIVAISATTVLTLPNTAETGDMIRIVEVSGALTYNNSLIVRAPSGVAIQGDNTGTNAGGLSSAYGGGELIVQTRNAGFGLVYMGAQDGGGATIPTTYRGWWLTEI